MNIILLQVVSCVYTIQNITVGIYELITMKILVTFLF